MKWTVIIIFIAFFTHGVLAQNNNKETQEHLPFNSEIDAVVDTLKDIRIFDEETPMNMVLKYDITSFIRNKMKGEYLDAELEIEYKGYTSKKDIRLKARGNNRRETCFFPPIYLNFKTDPIENSELEGFKKVKLVTHCSTAKSYTDYILREYLVYKIYNILTENSLRARLLNIKYIDTGKKERNYEKHGILLEPIEVLVERTNAVEINGEFVRSNDVLEEQADMVALFQYFIGNTDWRIKGGHNTKFVKSLTAISPKVTPVPYDFDYAGFVGTSYSHPQAWTSIETVQEREYMGYCRSNEGDYMKAINLFIEKKEEILETIKSFEYIDEKEEKSLLNYVEQFYSLAEKPKVLIGILKRECRDADF